MQQRTSMIAAAVGVLLLNACGASTPGSPSPLPPSELLAAPTRIVADGKGLTLTTFLWRDFMPISPPDGKPLVAVLTIRTDDGTEVPASLTAGASFVIHDGEVWSASAEQRPRAETAPNYEVVARDGPKWNPGVSVDVVVRLVDSSGRTFLLRAPAQKITATM